MQDAETIKGLKLEVRRLRTLISLMADHGEQTVCYVTIALNEIDAEKMRMVITHSDELTEERFGLFVGNEVKRILEKLYETGVELEIERKESPR